MTDWAQVAVEVVALVAGPLLAVLYSSRRERLERQRDREREERDRATTRKTTILRQLLAVRPTPGDPTFSAAINLIPIEFAASEPVLAAWETFIRAVAREDIKAEQAAALLRVVMLDLGYGEQAARQITLTPYFATALAQQHTLIHDALRSLPRLATATEVNTRALAELVERSRAASIPPA